MRRIEITGKTGEDELAFFRFSISIFNEIS